MGTTRTRGTKRQRWLLAGGATLAAVLLVVLAEILLALLGVGDADDDPFFDFEAVTGLFERVEHSGGAVYRTRDSKRAFFNLQEFAAAKDPGTFRVFALGGSTTYGRPYDWQVAFPSWLRHLLQAGSPGQSVEVINAGGVSYASYRVRVLMQELLDYEPDLLVVYTGQNEFLEERVYGERLREGALLRSARRGAAGLRSVRALRSLFASEGTPKQAIASEVHTRLDVWEGLQSFTRNDGLREEVIAHFAWNLEAMIDLAEDAGVPIVFVAPASNVRDFSPFKSEHRDGLKPDEQGAFELASAAGRAAHGDGDHARALAEFEKALAIDDQFAELHFWLGRAHGALGHDAKAGAAYRRALETDVCPLRAIAALGEELRRVTAAAGVPMVDLPALLAARGHDVPGDESFLDHVHLNMSVHQLLAEALAEVVVEQRWLEGAKLPAESQRTRIYDGVVAGLDPVYYAQRDLNLAKVLSWSGKYAEATAALMRARELLADDPELHYNLGILMRRQQRPEEALAAYRAALALDAEHFLAQFGAAKSLQELGRNAEAETAFRRATELEPQHAESWYNLAFSAWRAAKPEDALRALERLATIDPAYLEHERLWAQLLFERGGRAHGQGDLDAAARDYHAALEKNPGHAKAHTNLGGLWLQLGDPEKAAAAFERAVAIDPNDGPAHYSLAQVKLAGGDVDAARRHLDAAMRLGVQPSQKFLEAVRREGDGESDAGLPKAA